MCVLLFVLAKGGTGGKFSGQKNLSKIGSKGRRRMRKWARESCFVKSGTELTVHIFWPGADSFDKNALIIFLSMQKEMCKQETPQNNIRKTNILYLHKLDHIAVTKPATGNVLQSLDKSRNWRELDFGGLYPGWYTSPTVFYYICHISAHGARRGRSVLLSRFVSRVLFSPLATRALLLPLQQGTLALEPQRSSCLEDHLETTQKYRVLKG